MIDQLLSKLFESFLNFSDNELHKLKLAIKQPKTQDAIVKQIDTILDFRFALKSGSNKDTIADNRNNNQSNSNNNDVENFNFKKYFFEVLNDKNFIKYNSDLLKLLMYYLILN